MRCYRVATGRTIPPFGDPVRELFVGTRTVGQWQEDAVRACGLELVDVDDLGEVGAERCCVLHDDVWLSEMALRQFAAEALGSDRDLRLAQPDTPAAQMTEPLQDAPEVEGGRLHDVFFCAGREPPGSAAALAERAQPCLLPPRERSSRVRLPPSDLAGEGRGGREAVVPFTARMVANVRHWLHLLRLSQLSISVTLLDRLRKDPRRLLWVRLAGRDPWKVARRLTFVDPTARVHPTADIESSVIGPGCVVEAHAHVHRSVLGAGVQVGDHAAVVGCTLADEAQVLRASYFALCAAMPQATLASYKAQLSLFGRSVFLTTSAWLIDAKLKGEVSVEHEGERVPAGPFLGVCLGHRVTLGAQVLVQAGRAVPNGSVVVGAPDRFLSQVDAFPEGTVLTVRNGRLEPI